MMCQKCNLEKNDWEMCYDNKHSCPIQPCKDCKKIANGKSERAIVGKNSVRINGSEKNMDFRKRD